MRHALLIGSLALLGAVGIGRAALPPMGRIQSEEEAGAWLAELRAARGGRPGARRRRGPILLCGCRPGFG